MTNGSGDYAIAFSTANRINAVDHTRNITVLGNDAMSPLFQAVIEATETGNGMTVEALPLERVREIFRKHGRELK